LVASRPRCTAIGEGILTSLDAIAQVDHSVAPTGATGSRSRGAGYADDVIVVLTDGSNNRGDRPADRGEGGRRPGRSRLDDRLRYR
jgi:hypothetical protein